MLQANKRTVPVKAIATLVQHGSTNEPLLFLDTSNFGATFE